MVSGGIVFKWGAAFSVYNQDIACKLQPRSPLQLVQCNWCYSHRVRYILYRLLSMELMVFESSTFWSNTSITHSIATWDVLGALFIVTHYMQCHSPKLSFCLRCFGNTWNYIYNYRYKFAHSFIHAVSWFHGHAQRPRQSSQRQYAPCT